MTQATARCYRCGDNKPLDEIVRDRAKASGHASICKACDREKARAYYAANRERKLAKAKARQQARAADRVPLPTRICPGCDKKYTPHREDQRVCSRACRPFSPRTTITVVCVHCGKATDKEPRELRRYPRAFCTRSCAAKHRSRQVRKGCELVGPVERRVSVGPTCPISAAPPIGRRIAGYCHQCGDPFVSRGLWTTVYCSKRCARRAAAQARKARRKGNRTDRRVYRRKIYERDGWACKLCGKPVRTDKQVPHPKAPTLDHIVPESLGGAWSYENLQCAHFICNSQKGNRGHESHRPDQLQLIG